MLGLMPAQRSTLRVAAAAYPVRFLSSWDDYAAGLTRWVEDAARQGAELLVFPEYAPLELVSLLPEELHHDILGMRPALQALLPGFLALHERLAREHAVTLVAGSFRVPFSLVGPTGVGLSLEAARRNPMLLPMLRKPRYMWTFKNLPTMEWAVARGIDWIATDYPGQAAALPGIAEL